MEILLRTSILLRFDACCAAYCCKLFSFRGRNKMSFHEIVDSALVLPSPFARRRHRGRNYHQLETRHGEDKLAAMSPGIMDRLPAQSIDPPAVSVVATAPARLSARLERFFDPIRRDDLFFLQPATVEVELAVSEHGSRSQMHVVAAQVNPLRVADPRADRNAKRFR